MPTPIIEHLTDWHSTGLRVDRDARRVYDIALTAAESANGYHYLPAALEAALPLYEQKPVFLDHAPQPSKPRDRSMRDLVGTIRGARYVAGRIRGDIEVLDTEAGRIFLGLVAAHSPALGMSHVVLAKQDPATRSITEIVDVISVDAVAFPATAATFAEQAPPEITEPLVIDPPLPDPSCTDTSIDDTPHLTQTPTPTPTPTATPEALELAELRAENLRLTQQLTELQETARTQALLEAAHLPPELMTPDFRQLLADTPASLRPALIHERSSLAKSWKPTPASHTRRPPGSTHPTDASIIETIKRRFGR